MDTGLGSSELLVAAKLAAHQGDRSPSIRQLGAELDMPKSNVQKALAKLREFDLIKDEAHGERRLNRIAFRECIENAVRWIAPAKVGDFELGLPTAHASDALRSKFSGDEDPVVIPLPHGPLRGRAISPLHPLAPRAAAKDPKLHQLLALIDVFRVGRARDRAVAASELRAWL